MELSWSSADWPTRAVPHAISGNAAGDQYGYDADGNLETVLSASGNVHRQFDSQNRLVCQGAAPGMCGVLSTRYDATGNRLWDRRYIYTGGGYWLEHYYVDELFELYVDDSVRIGFSWIYAFGERVGRKGMEPVVLRQAGVWPVAWPQVDPLPPLFALLVLSALVGGGYVVRRGWLDGAWERPGAAWVSGTTIVALVCLPVPAHSGGGGVAVSRLWLLSDPLGTVTTALRSDGTAALERLHRPFGAVEQETNSGVGVFAGHRTESGTGLVYMQARWMDPATGTFLSVDPLVPDAGDPQSYNAYAYSRNNPIMWVDPTGEAPVIGWPGPSGRAFLPTVDYGEWGYEVTFTVTTKLTDGKGNLVDESTYSFSLVSSMPPGSTNDLDELMSEMRDLLKPATATSQSGAAASTASSPAANPSGGNWLQRAGGYLGRLLFGEAGEIYGGVFGTLYGVGKGLFQIGKGIATADFGSIGRGFGTLGSALAMPRSGSHSGLGWPGTRGNTGITPATGTKLNNASIWHDTYTGTHGFGSAAQFGWIERAWAGPGTELGPYGQAYRLLGTVGFGLAGAAQAAAGF